MSNTSETVDIPYPIVPMHTLPDKTPVLIPIVLHPDEYYDMGENPMILSTMVTIDEDVLPVRTINRLLPSDWQAWHSSVGNISLDFAAESSPSRKHHAFLPAMTHKPAFGLHMLEIVTFRGEVVFTGGATHLLMTDTSTLVFHLDDLRYIQTPSQMDIAASRISRVLPHLGTDKVDHIKNISQLEHLFINI